MPRSDIDIRLKKIDELVGEIDQFVPRQKITSGAFRADLAGLLVVTISATYESCVKEVLIRHASNHHPNFEIFVENNFKKINSKINISDLKKYADNFDPKIKTKFNRILSIHSQRIFTRTGIEIKSAYHQILQWRHEFAHSGARNTTVEEAAKTNTAAKRVLYAFEAAFNG